MNAPAKSETIPPFCETSVPPILCYPPFTRLTIQAAGINTLFPQFKGFICDRAAYHDGANHCHTRFIVFP